MKNTGTGNSTLNEIKKEIEKPMDNATKTVNKKAPAKKTPAKKTPAKKAAPAKNNSQKAPKERKLSETELKLDRVLSICGNFSGTLKNYGEKLNKLDDDVKKVSADVAEIKNRRTEFAPGTPDDGSQVPATATSNKGGDNMDNGWRRFVHTMSSERKVPLWVLLLLLLVVLSLLASISMVTSKPGPQIPTTATTTVTAERGGIAVNGNVTITVPYDRYDARNGGEVDATVAHPLVVISYNGDDGLEDDSIVITTDPVETQEEVKAE